jgi:limonene-1,2-epoxide hydrolase
MNDNEALMRRFLKCWATREWDAMADMFHEAGVYDNVPAKAPMKGREAVREWLKSVFAHLTRIDVDVLRIVANGEWILTERVDVHVIGDRHMALPVMNSSRIVNGTIVMFRDYYDQQTVAELGMG